MHDRVPIKTDTPTQSTPVAERKNEPKWVGTRIVDDVFTDAVTMVKPRFEVDYSAYVDRLWGANPEIHRLLKDAPDPRGALRGLAAIVAPRPCECDGRSRRDCARPES